MTNDHRPIDRLDDEELFAVVRAGSPRAHDAFGMLLYKHAGRVRGRVAAKLHGLPDAVIEEVTQDVFLALNQAAVEGKVVEKVKPWLNQVVRHKTADYFRSRDFREIQLRREGLELDGADPDAPPRELGREDAGVARLHVDDVVESVLSTRSEKHRAILDAAAIRGEDPATVAAEHGTTVANVYKVAQRFRDDLRAALDGDAPPNQTDHRT